MDITLLSERFAIIALNGMRTSNKNYFWRLKSKCITIAKFFDFVLMDIIQERDSKVFLNNASDAFVNTLSETDRIYLNKLNNRSISSNLISDMIQVINRLSSRFNNTVSNEIINSLESKGILRICPALLSSDLFYHSEGVKLSEYRSSSSHFNIEIDFIKSEILENSEISDEVIFLIWLLIHSGDLKYICSAEEINNIQNKINQLYLENKLVHNLFDASLNDTLPIWSAFLKKKKDFAQTKFGSGFVFGNPYVQRDESIFIDTETMFPDPQERIRDVKDRLEANGHHCELITGTVVPLMKIDNVLYHLVPHAIRMNKINIHGVRLRRYLV